MSGGRGIEFQAIYNSGRTGAADMTQQDFNKQFVTAKEFGAKGDGVTDDTAAFSSACTHVAANGGILRIPRGTYIVGSTAFAPLAGVSNVCVRGDGMERTILQSISGGTVIDLSTAAYFQRFEIGDLAIVGAGSSGNSGHGIHIANPANVANQIHLHDLSIRGCGGKGVYVESEFSSRFTNVMVGDCADNLFDIAGGNTVSLYNCYAETVNAGFAGYRIHGGNVVMISCNGINNVWGVNSPTGLSEDQADWGVFGSELLTAWAQNTAYTLGQQRKANGMEFEVITAGTSDVAGTGPAAISKDILDGSVHWRHIGAADSVNLQMSVTLISCNIEDATRHGLHIKNGGTVYVIASTFIPPPGAGAASPGLIGLFANFVDPAQKPIVIDGISTSSAGSFAQYDHGVMIHQTSGLGMVRFGGTTNAPSVYARQTGLTANAPSITVANAGNSSGSATFTALLIDRLKMTSAPGAGHVNPTYGPSVVIDPNLGWHFNVTATNATNFTITNPGVGGSSNVGVYAGQRLTISVINNNAVGPNLLGVITWGTKYKMAAFTAPAFGFRRSVTFEYDGTNWYDTTPGVDIAN